jgi:hypothetical protein
LLWPHQPAGSHWLYLKKSRSAATVSVTVTVFATAANPTAAIRQHNFRIIDLPTKFPGGLFAASKLADDVGAIVEFRLGIVYPQGRGTEPAYSV